LAKIKDLSKEDAEPLTAEDLTNGASLILTYDKKDYPVTFLKFKGKNDELHECGEAA
jgi:benzoyl-CoA reductase/2-hydroxyglutaryl-CoA dehydratase subunit BcrC/BadD/HgdB